MQYLFVKTTVNATVITHYLDCQMAVSKDSYSVMRATANHVLYTIKHTNQSVMKNTHY